MSRLGPFLIFVVILFGFVAAAYLLHRWKPQFAQAVSRYAQVMTQTRAYQEGAIGSDEELVASVDRFVFFRFGYGAHWWHGGHVRQQLLTQHPQLHREIEALLAAYEAARYNESSNQLTSGDFAASVSTLRTLVSQSGPPDVASDTALPPLPGNQVPASS